MYDPLTFDPNYNMKEVSDIDAELIEVVKPLLSNIVHALSGQADLVRQQTGAFGGPGIDEGTKLADSYQSIADSLLVFKRRYAIDELADELQADIDKAWEQISSES